MRVDNSQSGITLDTNFWISFVHVQFALVDVGHLQDVRIGGGLLFLKDWSFAFLGFFTVSRNLWVIQEFFSDLLSWRVCRIKNSLVK